MFRLWIFLKFVNWKIQIFQKSGILFSNSVPGLKAGAIFIGWFKMNATKNIELVSFKNSTFAQNLKV